MSLEIAIQQNTAAINELISLLKGGAVIPPPVADEPDTPAETAAPVKATKAAKAAKATNKEAPAEAPAGEPASPAASAPSPEPGAPAASETEAAAPATKQVNYSDAAVFVNKVAAKKGRDTAVGILAKFGAKTLGEVKASSYADVIKECEAVL